MELWVVFGMLKVIMCFLFSKVLIRVDLFMLGWLMMVILVLCMVGFLVFGFWVCWVLI